MDHPTAGLVTGRPAAATAYVPERFPPALPFPVLRYLTHLGRVRGLTTQEATARARYWLERFGITGYARTPLDELSKGTCQKVAVAQALLAGPRLLVLDEAWTGLDAAARDVLDAAVRERVAAGGTVFFVDHDPRRLADAATAVYAVDTGRMTAAAGRGPAREPAVVIEAAGEGPVPADAEALTPAGAGRVRGTVPAERSDAVLRALLVARPPWHITSVRAAVAEAPGAYEGVAAAAGPVTVPTSVGAGAARGPRMGALLRYQLDLLMRSHRWLPPLLFYGAVMAIGVAGGEPLLGSLGYAAALLLPVAAWTVRVCVTNEPGAARACVASAVGAARAQRAAVGAAAMVSGVLGLAGTALVTAVSGPHADDLTTAVPVGPAALAGLMAAAVSVLLGTAVGALTNPPLVRGSGWPILVTAVGAGAVLIVSGSPAQAAVTDLVTGSRTGAVHYPLPALVAAAVAAAAATLLSGWSTTRLGP